MRVITIPTMHRSAQVFRFHLRCIMGNDGNYDMAITVAIATSYIIPIMHLKPQIYTLR